MLPGSRRPRTREPMAKSQAPERTGSSRGGQVGRIVRPVAVHEHDEARLGGHRAGEAGAAVAPACVDHLGAGLARQFAGGVGAAAVGDDHRVHAALPQFGDHRADGLRLVQRGDDDGDVLHHRLPAVAACSRSCTPSRSSMAVSSRRV